MRTAVGVLEVVSVVEVHPGDVTVADARAAGAADLAEVTAEREGRPLFRVELCFVGGDPREALRAVVPAGEEMASLLERLAAIDHRSRRGPWTDATLELIARHPARRAVELAADMEWETLAFKRHVRVLKELGLTESLGTGYRLSPRGEAVLESLHGRPHR